jgi:hypothetical protein
MIGYLPPNQEFETDCVAGAAEFEPLHFASLPELFRPKFP